MSNYPKINYIGNKHKLTDWIIENFPVKSGSVLDLFCGGSSVSYALKKKNYKIIANDCLFSNYVLNKAIIENGKEKLSINDLLVNLNEAEIKRIFDNISPILTNVLFYENEVLELAKYICLSEKLTGYKKYLLLSLIRRAMIRKLPYSRMNVPWNQILKLRDEKYSYEKYGRKRAYHNLSFEKLILADLNNYNSSVFDNGQPNKSFHSDAFDFIRKFDKKVDVVYMDPPYPNTMNKYGDFYGLFDKITNNCKPYKNLSADNAFIENLVNLIVLCKKKTGYIVISLNNKTKPTITELQSALKDLGTIKIIEKAHQYKVTNKSNKNTTIEQLLILKVNETG